MRWVESGDVRLAVFEEGDPAHPTVMLLHGYPDTHRVWDEVAARLRDRFHVVRYDVRGAGAPPRPPTGATTGSTGWWTNCAPCSTRWESRRCTSSATTWVRCKGGRAARGVRGPAGGGHGRRVGDRAGHGAGVRRPWRRGGLRGLEALPTDESGGFQPSQPCGYTHGRDAVARRFTFRPRCHGFPRPNTHTRSELCLLRPPGGE
jgi:hypothetical protein